MTIDEAKEIQASVNSGLCWQREGACGREVMAAMAAGDVMLGPEPLHDFWGNRVPARSEVKPGTKGSRQLVEQVHGRNWVEALAAVA